MNCGTSKYHSLPFLFFLLFQGTDPCLFQTWTGTLLQILRKNTLDRDLAPKPEENQPFDQDLAPKLKGKQAFDRDLAPKP